MDPAELPVELIDTILISLPLLNICDLLQSSKTLFKVVNRAIHNELWWRQRIAHQVPGAVYTGVHPALLSVNLEVGRSSYSTSGFLDFYVFLRSHDLITLEEWMDDPNSEATPEMVKEYIGDEPMTIFINFRLGEEQTFEHFSRHPESVMENEGYIKYSSISYRYLMYFADNPDITRMLLTIPVRDVYVDEAVKKVLVHPDFHPTPEVLDIYRELDYLDWLPQHQLVTDADYNEYLDAGYGLHINFLPNVFYYHVGSAKIVMLTTLRIEEWDEAIAKARAEVLPNVIELFLRDSEEWYVLAHPQWFETPNKRELAILGLDYGNTNDNPDPDVEELFRLNVGDVMEQLEEERMANY